MHQSLTLTQSIHNVILCIDTLPLLHTTKPRSLIGKPYLVITATNDRIETLSLRSGWPGWLDGKQLHDQTRMHSSRMRTGRS